MSFVLSYLNQLHLTTDTHIAVNLNAYCEIKIRKGTLSEDSFVFIRHDNCSTILYIYIF
jgi:hypothetical protein